MDPPPQIPNSTHKGT
jgi:hypothetical protein